MTAAAASVAHWREVEIDAWRPKTKLSVSQWAEANRVLSATSEERGPFRLRRVPYMGPIMDAATDPEVEEIVVCKAAQIAYTTTLENLVAYFATEESAAILFVLADEDTARYVAEERIEKSFIDSPALARWYDSGKFNTYEIKLSNGSYVAMAWASSVAKLGTKSFKYILLDEIDKPGYSLASREAAAISLAKERKESFYRFKIFEGSTPTLDSGNVIRELESCDVILDWHVPCPGCGTFQPLRFGLKYCHGFADGVYLADDGTFKKLGQVKWEGGRAATEEQVAAAGYECGTCGRIWTTLEKNHAVSMGKMVARAGTTGRRRKVGFHVNRLYSLLGKSGDIDKLVAAWIAAVKDGDPKAMQGFVNSTLAEPWVQAVIKKSEAQVLSARADLDPQTVPADAVGLTIGIDPQKFGFYFVVRAWARDYRSWLIHYGKVSTWDQVFSLIFETTYPVHEKGFSTRPWRAAIDTGGTRLTESDPTMTEAAYWFVRRYGFGRGAMVFGTKGSASPLTGYVQQGKTLDRMPSGKPIPGGLQLMLLDTGKLKDRYHYRLQSAITGEGDQPAYLHRDVKADYARQILAEEKRLNERGLAEWVRIRPDNHFLDCEVLAAAAADPEWPGGGVHILAHVIELETARRASRSESRGGGDESDQGLQRVGGGGYRRPSWMDR
jgi:phage terminase large subunit GpA-like protein